MSRPTGADVVFLRNATSDIELPFFVSFFKMCVNDGQCGQEAITGCTVSTRLGLLSYMELSALQSALSHNEMKVGSGYVKPGIA